MHLVRRPDGMFSESETPPATSGRRGPTAAADPIMHPLPTLPLPPDLLSVLTWPPPDGSERFTSYESDHPDFRLIPMASHRGWPVAICEAAVGRPFPSYAARREWRASLRSVHAVGILVFTDAAHSGFAWSWRERYPSGHTRYLEFDGRSRIEALRTAADRLGEFGSVIDGPAEIDPDVEKLLTPVFRSSSTGRESEEDDGLGRALGEIGRCDDPDRLRTTWRRLRGIAVLHPDCADGARLVRAAGTLEMVFVAAIERMRAFVADASILGGRRRPEHLRDMRTLSDAAEDRLWDRDTRRYVRRLIVQQNLFAVVRTRTAGRTVARDLLRYADVREGALPAIDCNVWREPGRSPHGCGPGSAPGFGILSPTSDGIAHDGERWPEEHLTEALELHRRAWEMVRRIRLKGGHFEDLQLAVSQLERRRSLLRRQLDDMAADAGSNSPIADELRFFRTPGERGLSLIVE